MISEQLSEAEYIRNILHLPYLKFKLSTDDVVKRISNMKRFKFKDLLIILKSNPQKRDQVKLKSEYYMLVGVTDLIDKDDNKYLYLEDVFMKQQEPPLLRYRMIDLVMDKEVLIYRADSEFEYRFITTGDQIISYFDSAFVVLGYQQQQLGFSAYRDAKLSGKSLPNYYKKSFAQRTICLVYKVINSQDNFICGVGRSVLAVECEGECQVRAVRLSALTQNQPSQIDPNQETLEPGYNLLWRGYTPSKIGKQSFLNETNEAIIQKITCPDHAITVHLYFLRSEEQDFQIFTDPQQINSFFPA